MLKRVYLFIIMTLMILPVSAGELEDALNRGDDVFLYLYTQKCKYCNEFSPVYNQLKSSNNRNYTFVKVDAHTPYGNTLMKTFKGYYVPYVLLLSEKKKRVVQITADCITEKACIERELKEFKNY